MKTVFKTGFIFVLLLSAAFGLYYFLLKDFSKPLKKPAAAAYKKIDKVKTPCRKAALTPLNQKGISSSKEKPLALRMKKLERLSSQPIDLVFKDIYGSVIDLSCFRGKKIIIMNFWASWCASCIEELPSLSRLAAAKKDQIFALGLSDEPLEAIKNFLKRAFPDLKSHIAFVKINKGSLADYFPENKSIPVTYIFDKKGLLKAKETGFRDWSKEIRLIEHILSF